MKNDTARFWQDERLPGVSLLSASYRSQSFSRHFHDEYALGVIEKGALGFNYRGESLVASEGMVNLVIPGEAHNGHPLHPEGWIYRMFYLSPKLIEKTAKEIFPHVDAPPVFTMGVINDPGLAAMVLRLHRNMDTPSSPLSELQTGLYELLAFWITRYEENLPGLAKPGYEPKAVRLLRDFLSTDLTADLSLEKLSGIIGLSPFHLSRTFQRHTGLPPHAYRTQARVNHAKELLKEGIPISEAALASGFADQSHLNRHFRKITGVTPGQYSKIVQDR